MTNIISFLIVGRTWYDESVMVCRTRRMLGSTIGWIQTNKNDFLYESVNNLEDTCLEASPSSDWLVFDVNSGKRIFSSFNGFVWVGFMCIDYINKASKTLWACVDGF